MRFSNTWCAKVFVCLVVLASTSGVLAQQQLWTSPVTIRQFASGFATESTIGLAVGDDGLVYFSDSARHYVGRIESNGAISVVAGLPDAYGYADGYAGDARFSSPTDVEFDSAGNLFVADSNNNVIRKIAPGGTVTTIAGNRSVYCASNDGTGSSAYFCTPRGLTIDAADNLYVTDGNRVRVMTPEGQVTTIAGAFIAGYYDGTGGTASFDHPSDLVHDGAGRLYVADTMNSAVRYVDIASRYAGTVAGGPWTVGLSDGSYGSIAAPQGIAINADGTLFVADGQGGSCLRRVSLTGWLSTAAGVFYYMGDREGTGSHANTDRPTRIVVTGHDRTYFSTSSGTVFESLPALPDRAAIDDNFAHLGEERQLFSSPQTASSWSWSVVDRPEGSQVSLANAATASPTFTPDNRGRYRFRMDALGSGADSISYVEFDATCTESPAPAEVVFTPAGVCLGSSGTAEASPGYFRYVWSIENGTIVGSRIERTVSFQRGPSGPSQLWLTVWNEALCERSQTIEIPLGTPTPPVLSSPETEICPLSQGGVDVQYDPNHAEFAWSIENGTITNQSQDGRSIMYQAGTSGPVRVSVTVTNNDGCTATSSIEIPLKTISPPVIVPGVTEMCPLEIDTASVAYDPTLVEYAWSIENGTLTSSSTMPYVYFMAGSVGPVRLTVTVTSNQGCTATNTIEIPLKTIPPPVIVPGVTEMCPLEGDTASVAYDPTLGGYAWSIENGTLTSSSTMPYVYFTAGSVGPVRLTVTVTSNQGCTATNTIEIPLKTIPPPVIVPGVTEMCPLEGDTASVAYDPTLGGYAWSIENGTLTSSSTMPYVYFTAGSVGPVRLTVTVTSNQGCTATNTIEIPLKTVTPPVIQAYFPEVCAASNSPAWVSYPNAIAYQWSIENGTIWSGMETGSNVMFTAGATGTVRLTVAVTTSDGCVATSTREFTIKPLPQPVIAASGPTTFCEGGSVVLTASGGTSYNWSTGATTQSITVTQPGSYSVRAVSDNGCDATSAETVVTVNPIPAATITPNGATTFCEGGSVVLTASAGASYLWSNGATTQAITATQSGNYSVTVTNASGCSSTSSATPVTVNSIPVATITPSGATTFCEGGSVVLTASAGASYLWSNGATTQAITATQPGNYSVTVTNASGCSSTSAPTAVTVNSIAEATITPNGATTFCEGGSVVLTASAGASYLWSNGATTQAITATQSGDYSVRVTNASGCATTSTMTWVSVNPLPDAAVTPSGAATFCPEGSVVLSAAAGGASYLWSNGATTPSITVSQAGSYSVTVTGYNGCSVTSAATMVTENPAMTASVSSSVAPSADGHIHACEGTTVLLTASVAGGSGQGYTYQWHSIGGAPIPGATSSTYLVTQPNYYFARVTDSAGCMAQSNVPVVEWDANLSSNFVVPENACSTSIDSATADESTGQFLWSITNGTLLSDPTLATVTYQVGASGTTTLTLTRPGACDSTTTRSITIDPIPAAIITPIGPTTFCEGASLILSASELGGTSYLWSNGATTANITVTQAGWYSVTVTNSSGCATTSAPVQVVVNPRPVATITPSGPTAICEGGSVVLTASGGVSYQWSTGETTQSITVTQPNSYMVQVSSEGGCAASASVVITPKATPTASVSGGGNVCAGGSATIQATLTGTAPFSITWSDGFVQSGVATSIATRSVSPSSTQNFTVSSIADSTCNGTSSGSALVTVTPLPTASVSGSATICNGSPATIAVSLTGVAPWTLTWSDGLVQSGITSSSWARSVNPATTTTYTVTAVSGASCGGTATGSATITVNQTPTITTQPASKAIRKKQSTTLTVSATGTGTLSYQWFSGSSGNTSTPVGTNSASYTTPKLSSTTQYWVRVTNSCGSTNSATATVTVK